MTRRGVELLGACLAGFVVTGLAMESATGRPHGSMAVAALAVGLTAMGAAKLVEFLTTRRGVESIVVGYWVGVGVRGSVALVGTAVLAQIAFEPADRQLWLLWLLAAYLMTLVLETVRSVRAADLARVATTGSGGGPNE